MANSTLPPSLVKKIVQEGLKRWGDDIPVTLSGKKYKAFNVTGPDDLKHYTFDEGKFPLQQLNNEQLYFSYYDDDLMMSFTLKPAE